MTNEELAKHIALDCCYDLNDSASISNIELGAEKMAELKDQQFKEYLEKRASETKYKRDSDDSYGPDWDNYDNIYRTYMGIINELFKGK